LGWLPTAKKGGKKKEEKRGGGKRKRDTMKRTKWVENEGKGTQIKKKESNGSVFLRHSL
jgi:hypothetical protein